MIDALDSFEQVLEDVKKMKNWSLRFDTLLAFTRVISNYDIWLHDHEADLGGEKLIAALAKEWKKLLSKDDMTLGLFSSFKTSWSKYDDYYDEHRIQFNFM